MTTAREPGAGMGENRPVRIAVAASGLGHVARGVESWADDLASALHRHGMSVSLFQGGGQALDSWRHTVRCWPRSDWRLAQVLRLTRRLGGWRYGFGSPYEAEQTTFAVSLWRAIHAHHDILHVQDPWVGRLFHVLHRIGWSRPRVILAHGTEEDDKVLRSFRYLQHLAPCYRDAWEAMKPPGQLSFAIPNFVDTSLFRPGDRTAARKTWNLPEQALVVLSVAALNVFHKRSDYVIREFAEFRRACGDRAILVLAGTEERETPAVEQLAASLPGDSVRILKSVDRAQIPSLYQAADVFALGSLHEMLGTALIEALACGVPVTCHRTPALTWVAGPAGSPQDLSEPGGLVAQWRRLLDPQVRSAWAREARPHVQRTFSEPVVLRDILDMYQAVVGADGAAA